jgi:hypothetical protein
VVRLAVKHLGEFLGYFILPLAHLYQIDLVLGGYRVNRLDALRDSRPTQAIRSGLCLPGFL